MSVRKIDINCDVGEGINNEADLFPFITSCNIACGGHAGNADSIRSVIRLAAEHKVKIGAHPSYPDREHFGRRSLALPAQALIGTIQEQLMLFFKIASQENVSVHHIKAHGALYNDIAKDASLARNYLRALVDYERKVAIYAPYGSALAGEAQARGWSVLYEAFADRNYNADLSLVSRSDPEALITDADQMAVHLLRIFEDHAVRAIDGTDVPIQADTFCIHGDTPGAVTLLHQLVGRLEWHRIQLDK